MSEIWTIGRLLKWTEGYFNDNGIETARLDAEVLLGHVLGKERIYLYIHFDQPLQQDELAAFKACIKKRVQRMPVAYIVGRKEFMGLDFQVNEYTLVPRPDTEILVEAAIERLKAIKKENGIIADIGTGSGAICLSVLHYLPEARAVTVDISEEALAVAKANAEALEVSNRIELLQGDMLKPVKDRRFSAILSNPPYIPDADIEALEPEVKVYEPMGALAGGTDGLDFYRQLTGASGELIEDGGFLAMEIGIGQAEDLLSLAEQAGCWQKTEVVKDLAGIERVVILWK